MLQPKHRTSKEHSKKSRLSDAQKQQIPVFGWNICGAKSVRMATKLHEFIGSICPIYKKVDSAVRTI